MRQYGAVTVNSLLESQPYDVQAAGRTAYYPYAIIRPAQEEVY